jgi:hypothetical protein
MYKHNAPHIPITLEGLNQKLDFETKRLLREREEGVVKRISKIAILKGNSTLVFKNQQGAKITLLYRLDQSDTLRFAYEKQSASTSDKNQKHLNSSQVGRASRDIV